MKPLACSRRQSSAPFRQPLAHSRSSLGSQRGQAALSDPKDVLAFAAQDLADEFSAETREAVDTPDRDAVIGHPANHAVGLQATLKPFMLKPFRRRPQLRIERLCSDRLPNGRHTPLHGRQESRACVLEQMPAIGDLHRLRQGARDGAPIAAVAVTGDDFNSRPGAQPRLHRRRLTVWKEIDHPPPLKIADQRSVALSLAPGPVVDADEARRGCIVFRYGPEAAEERVLADRLQQTMAERFRRSAAERQGEAADQSLQARRAPCMRLRDGGGKPFREYLAGAERCAAPKATHRQMQFNRPTMGGKIIWTALIPAMNLTRGHPAARTGRSDPDGACVYPDYVTTNLDPIGPEPSRQETLSSNP